MLRARPADYLSVLLLALFWSPSYFLTKIALDAFPPVTLVAVRIAVAAIVVCATAAAFGHRLPRRARGWAVAATVAVIGNLVPFLLITSALETIDSAVCAILVSVMPIATALMAHLALADEPLGARRLAAVTVGLGGALVLIGPAALGGIGRHLLAELAAVGGAVCYAASTVTARLIPREEVIGVSMATLLLAALAAAPVAFALESPLALVGLQTPETTEIAVAGTPEPGIPGAGPLLAVLALAVFSTGLATVVYFSVAVRAGAGFLSMTNYLVPVLAVLWGVVLLEETLTVEILLALALILLGIRIAGSATPAR